MAAGGKRIPVSGLTADQRYRVISQIIDVVGTTLRVGMFCGVALLVAYWTRDVLLAYAGRATMADVAIRLIADLKLDRALAYIFGAGGVSYGLLLTRQVDRFL